MTMDTARTRLWVLDGETPVQAASVDAWSEFLASSLEARRVAIDVVELPSSDPVRISTVFTGIDAALMGPPQVFETMVFGGPLDGHVRRYATWNEARRGHHILTTEVAIEGHALAASVNRQITAASRGRSHNRGD